MPLSFEGLQQDDIQSCFRSASVVDEGEDQVHWIPKDGGTGEPLLEALESLSHLAGPLHPDQLAILSEVWRAREEKLETKHL